jgi:PST family polysaccharide transporter
MSLRLAASMGAVQTAVSMVLSFVGIKVTSIYLGPAGIGMLGQLNYFMSMTQGILSSGVHTGLVRRTAELQGEPGARNLAISTVLRTLLTVGLPVALLIALASSWLSRVLLHDSSLRVSLLVFSAALGFGLVATTINACANGAKDFRTLAMINIGASVSSFILVVVLCPTFGVTGGLIALAILPIFTWAIASTLARRHAWWPGRPLSHGFSAAEARRGVAFVPMAIVSSVGLPLLQLAIRDRVAAHSGMGAVGLLQGVMRISDMYIGVASGIFAMYFFPRFSEIRVASELSREIRRGFLVIVPSVALVSLAIYLLRDPIIRVIFTPEFLPMRELFAWQMAGNTLRMVGWLFGYVILAKANPLAVVVLEVMSLGLWWLLSAYLIGRHGTVGAPQAFAAAYALYSVATLVGVAVILKRMP